MLAKKIDSLSDMLVKHSKIKDKQIISYGLSLLLKYILNIFTTLILGISFGLVFESFVFLVSYMLLRSYTGGYHCRKASSCYLFSTLITLFTLTIIKMIPLSYVIILSLILLVISIPLIVVFAPIETPTKPLDDDEKKYFRKIALRNLIILLFSIVILFLFNQVTFMLTIALAIWVSALMVILEILRRKN